MTNSAEVTALHFVAKEYGVRPSTMVDPEGTLSQGVRLQFDYTIAAVALKTQQEWERTKLPQAGQAVAQVGHKTFEVSPYGSVPLDFTMKGARPWVPEDYRTPSDEEIDAGLKLFEAETKGNPMVGTSVKWGAIDGD